MILNRIIAGMLVILICIGIAGASTLNVGQGQTYSTIQSAIDASEAGDLISVSEGTYYENVILSKGSIAIIGKNKEKTIIDGKKTGSVIRIETDDVTISGFTIQNNGGSGKNDGGISLYNANNNMIANSIFSNNTAGITISSSSNNNVIAGNIIRSNFREGIKLSSCLDNKIYDNQIEKNQIGIYADSARTTQIYSNNLFENKDQVYDNSGLNTYDDGKSGNYWSNHKKTGPYNILLGGAKAVDNYPLSNPVTIKDVEISLPAQKTQEDKPSADAKKSTPGFIGFELLLLIIAIGFSGNRAIRKH